MKRFRLGSFLLLISLLIPLNVGYLYYDYYAEIDFLGRKHFAAEDEEDFLTVVKKNPRLLYYPGLSAQHAVVSALQTLFLPALGPVPSSEASRCVLRC